MSISASSADSKGVISDLLATDGVLGLPDYWPDDATERNYRYKEAQLSLLGRALPDNPDLPDK